MKRNMHNGMLCRNKYFIENNKKKERNSSIEKVTVVSICNIQLS